MGPIWLNVDPSKRNETKSAATIVFDVSNAIRHLFLYTCTEIGWVNDGTISARRKWLIIIIFDVVANISIFKSLLIQINTEEQDKTKQNEMKWTAKRDQVLQIIKRDIRLHYSQI